MEYFKGEIEKKEAEINNLNDEKERLKKEKENEMEYFKGEIEKKEAEIKNLNDEKERLKIEKCDEIKNLNDKINSLKSINDEKSGKINKLEDDIKNKNEDLQLCGNLVDILKKIKNSNLKDIDFCIFTSNNLYERLINILSIKVDDMYTYVVRNFERLSESEMDNCIKIITLYFEISNDKNHEYIYKPGDLYDYSTMNRVKVDKNAKNVKDIILPTYYYNNNKEVKHKSVVTLD